MNIALGADHGGYELKEEIKAYLLGKGYTLKDFGTDSPKSCDYPVFAKAACASVLSGESDCAILFCGTGIGISMAANKIKGIRCGHCTDPLSAHLTKLHNNANAISLGGRITGGELAKAIVDAYLTTEYMGQHHQKRLDMLTEIENS